MQTDPSNRHEQAVAASTARLDRQFRAQATIYLIVSLAVAVYLFIHMGGLQTPRIEIVAASIGGALILGLFAYWVLSLLVAAIVAVATEYLPQLRK